jgi:thiol-disulfide isomerase/thioredoxin
MDQSSQASKVRIFLGAGVFLAAITLLLAFVRVDRAEAIAAFSRNYKTECTTCHTIFPQLNEFGQAFEKNGFVWPHAVSLAKKVKVEQTAEERKSAEYISLSGLPALLPLSVNLRTSYTYNHEDGVEDEFEQKNLSAQLLAAGAFGGDMLGFWFNQTLGSYTAGASAPGFWLVLRDPLGIPAHLRAGKFSPDLNLRSALLVRPAVSAQGYTVNGFSWTGSNAGLELILHLGPRVQLVVGMNDRNNNTASAAPATVNDKDEVVPGKAAQPNSVNDFYGRIGAKFGGADYHGKEPNVDLDKDSVWDYLSVSVGAFGYSGTTSTGDSVNHDVYRVGLQAEALYKKALLMFGATFGENNADLDDPVGSSAFSAGFEYLFSAKYAAGVRYDVLNVDGKDRRTVITPGIIYAPLQAFKLQLGASIDSNPTSAATGKANANTTATLTATLHF